MLENETRPPRAGESIVGEMYDLEVTHSVSTLRTGRRAPARRPIDRSIVRSICGLRKTRGEAGRSAGRPAGRRMTMRNLTRVTSRLADDLVLREVGEVDDEYNYGADKGCGTSREKARVTERTLAVVIAVERKKESDRTNARVCYRGGKKKKAVVDVDNNDDDDDNDNDGGGGDRWR